MTVAPGPDVIYGLTGIAVFAIGLLGALVAQDRLRRLMALKLASVGAGFLLVVGAWRPAPLSPDPMPHALVITGIVVMVSATALALALIRRLQTLEAAETAAGTATGTADETGTEATPETAATDARD